MEHALGPLQFSPVQASDRGATRASRHTTIATLEVPNMLWTITVLLLVLWLVGMVSNYTLGGFIHLLLLLAIASVLVRIIQGRRPV